MINKQREVIYAERDKVLAGDDVHGIVIGMIEDEIRAQGEDFSGGGSLAASDAEIFWAELGGVIPLDGFDTDAASDWENEEVIEALIEHALDLYDQRAGELGDQVLTEAERQIGLRIIDRAWIGHLTEMDSFRHGVGLQAYGQQDPLVTYKREAFDMFDQLTATIRREVARAALRMQVRPPADAPASAAGAASPRTPVARRGGRPPRRAITPAAAESTAQSPAVESRGVRQMREISSAGNESAAGAPTATKVGRNQPCPCGSGKKYKRCHGVTS